MYGQYLAGVLQSTYGRSMLSSIQTGAMHPHLNCGAVKFVPIPVPSLEEQRGIIDYLIGTNARFDELISEATEGIALLRERRSALVSAIVTGKIDVRGLVVQQEAVAA